MPQPQQYLENHAATWQVPDTDLTVIVPFAINGPNPDKLLLTGFGEADIAEIARGLGRRGIADLAVCNLVYAPDADGRFSSQSIGHSIMEGTRAVVTSLQSRNPSHGKLPVVGIGNSKGAGEQIVATQAYPWLYSDLILNAPPGVTNQSLGADLRARRRELFGRMKIAGLTEIQPGSEGCVTEIRNNINYTLDTDGAAMVRGLHELGLVKRLFVGEDDVLFPPHEYERALGLGGFVESIKGAGHMSLNTAEGLDYMARIIGLGLADHAALTEAA